MDRQDNEHESGLPHFPGPTEPESNEPTTTHESDVGALRNELITLAEAGDIKQSVKTIKKANADTLGSKLHLNAKGSALLAVHFIKFLKGGGVSTPRKRRQNHEDFQRSAIQKLGELLKIIVPPDKSTLYHRRK